MNPSVGNMKSFGLSNQTGNSQRMTSSNRFHPYTTAVQNGNIPAQSFGERFPQSSSASPYGLPAPAALAQNGPLQRFNMPVGNYQNPHPGPALPQSAGYSRPAGNAATNYQNRMAGRAGPTSMAMLRPNYVGVSQDRAFPSQSWQALPPASQMMPGAGGDAFPPAGQVTSHNKQGKAMVNKGNPARSQGLRVLSGRVGKVKEWAGLALPCPVLFRVHGTLATEVESAVGTKSNSKSKQFELAGEDGQQLHCTFMEIDREVANVKKGQRVVVTGRAKQDGSMQVVTVEGETSEAHHCLARLENFAVRGVRLVLRQKDSEAAAV